MEKDLYEYELSGRKREGKLGYADYESLVKKTKAMSKEELEKEYINRKNRKPLSDGGLFILFLFISLFVIFIFMACVTCSFEKHIAEFNSFENEVCTNLPENYRIEVIHFNFPFRDLQEFYTIDCSSIN